MLQTARNMTSSPGCAQTPQFDSGKLHRQWNLALRLCYLSRVFRQVQFRFLQERHKRLQMLETELKPRGIVRKTSIRLFFLFWDLQNTRSISL